MADPLRSLARGQGFLDDATSARNAEPDHGPLRAIDVVDFLQMTLPAREEILTPWLLTQSLSMIHSWRGVGKTHVALGIAYAVASGGEFLNWTAAKPRKVLYIDGEMPATALQARLADIALDAGSEALPGMLRLITPDLVHGPVPDLATPAGQQAVNAVLDATELIVLDNLSCLARSGGRENDAESWMPVAQWALQMRSQRRSVLFIHHSAKGGQQRGTSKREDLLDTVLRLKEPSDYVHGEGARFEIHYEKARNLHGEATTPIEARLVSGADHRGRWEFSRVEETTFDRVVALANDGLSRAEIVQELGCNRSTVFRHWRKAEGEGRIQRKAGGELRGTMSDRHDVLHVARHRECSAQHPAPSSATTPATPRATTALRAAALRVLARNKACNNRATAAEEPVQQMPAATAPVVASKSSLADDLAELNGLLARLQRWGGIGAPDTAGAQAPAEGSVDEMLRGLRHIAECLPPSIADDRITCRQCRQVVGSLCSLDARTVAVDQPRRCRSFTALPDATDQRSGRERWPWVREVGS